ncbi:MAG: autotransporter outer membrane beta-barrel domain-containing protein [Chitinophagales bacterium]|nr:autotransporter outer membrane beta-barrel domain-containing protein [Hyphomicrobiales bacterium]
MIFMSRRIIKLRLLNYLAIRGLSLLVGLLLPLFFIATPVYALIQISQPTEQNSLLKLLQSVDDDDDDDDDGNSGNGNAGNGNNGNGNGNAGNGNNGNGNGNAGNGNNGNGNGNAGNGNNGNGNGNAGNGNNGNGNGNAGNGNNGNGNNGNGNAVSGSGEPSQTTTSVVNKTFTNQVQQIIEKEMDEGAPGAAGAALSGMQQHNFHDSLSLFTISSVSWMRHDGLTVFDPDGKSKSASFETVTYGLTAGARLDASALFNLKPDTVTFGGFGNYTTSDFSTGELSSATGLGKGDLQSYAIGGYSVVNAKPFYLLGIFGHSWGDPSFTDTSNQSKASYETAGYVASLHAGVIVPAGAGFKIDFRAGLTHASSEADNYNDSAGVTYNDPHTDETNGSASAKIFSSSNYGDWTLRPFFQGGVSYRFSYENEVVVDGTAFRFDDADESFFGRVGLDLDHKNGLQSFLSVRGDASPDSEGLTGQAGLTIKLD